jgi:iron(III) transport system permease protein
MNHRQTGVGSDPFTLARLRAALPDRWLVLTGAIVALTLLPLFAIVVLALRAKDSPWAHLVATVLPDAISDTLLLMAGVGALTLACGTGGAWLITMYRFPGRVWLDRLMVLPLAMPTYIVAYCYGELLEFSGPIQSGLRGLTGWQTPRDYWFPEVRSLGGAIFVISAVLYPYVYLSARASFVQQSVCVLEVARTLGRTSLGAFWSVALPMARPALAAGVALVLMECLNDLGAVQHLGVSTLSVSVYTTWLQRSSLGGAAQIALVALVFVALLAFMERAARGRGSVQATTGRFRAIPFSDLEGRRGYAAAALCLLPVTLGFFAPAALLVSHAINANNEVFLRGFWRGAAGSITLATLAALVTVALGVLLAYAQRIGRGPVLRAAVGIAGLGYAIPGTVLALGLLLPLAGFDNAFDGWLRSMFGVSSGLLLSGTLAIVVLAYVIRFLAVSLGAIEAGLARLSPNLDAAARTLGETAISAVKRVHLPLLIPSLGAAALLVFVDAMKELPATLLLRPLNFETLATQVYSFAALEQFEQASLGALAIVAVGLIPVLALHQAIAGGRAGS